MSTAELASRDDQQGLQLDPLFHHSRKRKRLEDSSPSQSRPTTSPLNVLEHAEYSYLLHRACLGDSHAKPDESIAWQPDRSLTSAEWQRLKFLHQLIEKERLDQRLASEGQLIDSRIRLAVSELHQVLGWMEQNGHATAPSDLSLSFRNWCRSEMCDFPGTHIGSVDLSLLQSKGLLLLFSPSAFYDRLFSTFFFSGLYTHTAHFSF